MGLMWRSWGWGGRSEGEREGGNDASAWSLEVCVFEISLFPLSFL